MQNRLSQAQQYLIWLSTPLGIFVALFLALALWTDPIVGDLTRIGRWTENEYGFNAPQPIIRVLPNGSTQSHPDILVLGDSFSVHNFWQSVLAQRTETEIQSFKYNDVGCIQNWVNWAAEHSTADIIMIETVERAFVNRFAKLSSCPESTPPPLELPGGETSAFRSKWPPTFDAEYLFHSVRNALRTPIASPQTIRSGDSVNAPLQPDCARFSNQRADRLLYYAEDELKQHWKPDQVRAAIGNIRLLQQSIAQAGKQLIFVIVPDKLSVYQTCLRTKPLDSPLPNIVTELTRNEIKTPDLLPLFQSQSKQVVDLYNPDNTHWSPAGYSLLADALLRFLPAKNRPPPP